MSTQCYIPSQRYGYLHDKSRNAALMTVIFDYIARLLVSHRHCVDEYVALRLDEAVSLYVVVLVGQAA